MWKYIPMTQLIRETYSSVTDNCCKKIQSDNWEQRKRKNVLFLIWYVEHIVEQVVSSIKRNISSFNFNNFVFVSLILRNDNPRRIHMHVPMNYPTLQSFQLESLRIFFFKPYHPLHFIYISCILSPAFIFCIVSTPKHCWIVYIFTHQIIVFNSSF